MSAVFVPKLLNAQEKMPPNIILFLVDDMGWTDTSVPFGDTLVPNNKKYHTPNMERMAKQGVRFSHAYAYNVCTPTRTSLLTGVSAHELRITNWTNISAGKGSDHADDILQTPDWNRDGLAMAVNPSDWSRLLPAVLRDAGYYTIEVGKAHFGSQGTPASNPLNLGFNVSIAGSAIGHPQHYEGLMNYGNMPGRSTFNAVPGLQEFYEKDVHLSEALTRKAIDMVSIPVAKKQPFFLYFGHYAVHTPIQPDKRFVQRYYDAGLDSVEAAYASLVAGMDKSLGDIMDYLQTKNLTENTLILFMSDNGGLSDHARGGKRNTHNLPLRAGKGSVYEGGIRVPMLAVWPGKVPANMLTRVRTAPEDVYATVLEIGGVSANKGLTKASGRSFVSWLTQPWLAPDSTRPLLFHYPHRWTDSEDEAVSWSSALIAGQWKLVYRMKLQQLELYDLTNDPGEHYDLAAKKPVIVDKLAYQMAEIMRRRKVQMPVWKATGKAVAMPDEL